MKRFLSAIDSVNKRVGLSLSYLVLIMVGITLFEVIGRFAFASPTLWAHETTALLFGFYLIMAGGYTLLLEAHIRVDVIWRRFSPRNRAIVDLATCGFAFLFMTVLLWFGGRFAWESLLMLERSISVFEPPLYPSKIGLVIGVLLLLLQLIAKTIRDLRLAITGAEYA